MATKPAFFAIVLCLGSLQAGLNVASAGVIIGVDARNTFEFYLSEFGGTFIDFDDLLAVRLDNELTASHGVTFATIEDRFGNPMTPINVYVSTVTNRVGTIVGTPCTGCTDDGRYPYEIAFTQPQRWAGVERQWDSTTITRFFDPSDTLLAELTGSTFIGFVADTASTDAWVKRIMIDGVGTAGEPQVGYTDDLFFGTAAVPEPATSAWVLGSAIGLLALTRGKCISRGAESR